MALTLSTMMPLGTAAPDFTLPEPLTQKQISLSDIQGNKATLIVFICNHCPYVKHVEEGLIAFARDYLPQGLGMAAICSNDAVNFPEDSPEKIALQAKSKHYPFPYLYDETQQVAKHYNAACTPDFFLFDADLKCIFRGQFDESRPGNQIPVTGHDLRQALDACLSGEAVSEVQHPSIGCNIKWKD